MAAAEEALQAPARRGKRIHIEVFKSLESDPFAAVVIEEDDSDEGPATAIVTLDGDTHEVTWPRNAKLLDVLLDKGLDAPFSCREGHCGACAVLKKSGDVEMEINDVLEQSDLDEGLILGCQALPRIGFGRSHLRRVAHGLPFAAPKGATVIKRLTGCVRGGIGDIADTRTRSRRRRCRRLRSTPPTPRSRSTRSTTLEMHVTANCIAAEANACSTPSPTCAPRRA